jgi:hypothetical protein
MVGLSSMSERMKPDEEVNWEAHNETVKRLVGRAGMREEWDLCMPE